ncbi:hypothetical protein [Listeria grandensis]|uniref:hypothetical protein n=1 Tax=Listeria grandensis TaxID=1494963 RepID=UPI00164E9774|nr:hypothetical protein [Listeria grandensis]
MTGRIAKMDDVIFWKKNKVFLRDERVETRALMMMKLATVVQFILFVALVLVYFLTSTWTIALIIVFAVVYIGTNLFVMKQI